MILKSLILRNLPKRNKNIHPYKDIYMNVYSSIIHNKPKLVQFKYPAFNEWIDKMWCIKQ